MCKPVWTYPPKPQVTSPEEGYFQVEAAAILTDEEGRKVTNPHPNPSTNPTTHPPTSHQSPMRRVSSKWKML